MKNNCLNLKDDLIDIFSIDNLKSKLIRNRKTILLCVISTFIWGLIAHAYIFLNNSFSHDSLNEFNAAIFGNELKIQTGRVFVPIYRIITRGSITLPWLIGILSLFYISISVFLVIKLFKIQSKAFTILISGIFTVNITVIALAATYVHDLDCNMLSLLFSVLAVYLWEKYDKGYLFGVISVCISLGLYQSYISTTITLILLFLIMKLMNCEDFYSVFKKGLKAIVMLIFGGILYFIAIKIICFLTNISLLSGNYNSLDTIFHMTIPEILYAGIYGYIYTCYQILSVVSLYSNAFIVVIHLSMIIIAGIIILLRVFQKEIHIKEKILTLFLIALLPVGMNICFVLMGGSSHDLMHYAIWLVYLFILLIAWWTVEYYDALKVNQRKRICSVLVGLVVVILWSNVQVANAAYLKKDIEQDANLSYFTRILYLMESYDGYITGETPVVFVGKPSTLLNEVPGFESVYGITGSSDYYVLPVSERSYYQAYFSYILLNSAVMADTDTWEMMQYNYEVYTMSSYPYDNCIKMIDGVLVVKL